MLRKVETGSGTRCIARGGEGGRRGLKLNAVKSNVCVCCTLCVVLTLRLQSFPYSRRRDIWERNVICAICWWTILNIRIRTIRFDFRPNRWTRYCEVIWWKEANVDWRDIFRFEEDGENNRDSRDCTFSFEKNYFSFKPVLSIDAFSAL